MSSSAGISDALSTQNLELPPLRSLDDFVLGSARFQLPNIKDLEKWGNRVVKNLLYYQTNYFLLFLGIYGVMIIVNPIKIIWGLIVEAMIIAVVVRFFLKRTDLKFKFIVSWSTATEENPQQKWYFLASVLLCGYLLLYWLNAILLSSFALLLPISLTFVHASLRLRNIKNKVVNTMESFNPSTPMGVFLDVLNITMDN
ncbi:PREDICTED: PRA1 family protein 3 [Rhagoletis zephyria]|uniref:PRA1 family protein 3 n=1 Tax=Rhagoletis zephyria TaxID=28612 RepID=UPI0008112646|nr:PREDICTED: PRA1 family protein 3 [Rhagoletis zephyria]XP_036340928.1 PRA1 family protein 3 [Rhagoletis pomonella]